MKYVQFPGGQVTNSANNWGYTKLYENITTQYILILGLDYVIVVPPNLTSIPYVVTIAVQVEDQNGNIIDTVQIDSSYLTQQYGLIPIWNGTSVELENSQMPLLMHASVNRVGSVLIPPQCSLVFGVYSYNSLTELITGGWGLALDEEELMIYLGQKKHKNKMPKEGGPEW